MKISRSSDYSINFKFDNNLELIICYPLIRLSLTDIAIKLNTEISYYKFDHKEPLLNKLFNKELVNLIDYCFTFVVLGLGVIVTYTVKDSNNKSDIVSDAD